MLIAWLLLLAGFVSGQGPRSMTISAILDEGGDEIHELAFKHAVQVVNRNRDILPGVELKAHVEKVKAGDTFMAEKKTCELLGKGTVAILGPRSKPNSEHIRSITDSVEVPYIETRWNYRGQNSLANGEEEYAFNLHPDITTLGSAYLDLIETYSWKTITILYQDDDSMMTLKEIFAKTANIAPNDEFRLVVKQLAHNENGYRDVLKEIFLSESNLIVLDCEKMILEEVLMQCQQVGLISQGYYFLLTSLDAHTVNLENFKHGGTNFTAFRMIDVEKPDVKNVIYSIAHNAVLESGGQPDLQISGNLDTSTALIYDSVHAFALALHELSSSQLVAQRPLDCTGRTSWPHGNSLLNYMKMVEFVGLSGPIQFDEYGLRTQFALSLMELQMDGLVPVGSWNSLDRLSLERAENDMSGVEDNGMANKTFVITTILSPPYTMLVEKEEPLTGNDRFEGFSIDLTKELAKLLHFNYTFKLVDDGKYGNEVTPGSGNWNGMIKEVLEGTADFAIADISITSERASAVTFTMPWMNLGISILYVQPRPAPPNLLAFKEPFTNKVYVATLLVFVLVTLIIYVLARFSPNQWEEPPNCIKDPEEYENQYTLLNSFWFTMGALMQQGSDVAPIALCVRFAAGMWFFFALIMISSYTANLAAFLTVETLMRPINSAEDLANQNVIKYGTMAGGSTAAFFKDSKLKTYNKLWASMSGQHRAEVMVGTNTEGMEKVEEGNGNYAYFMESSGIAYLVERRCKLAQVGGLLDNKGYGIATKPGTPYKQLLDNAILKLMEGGVLHKNRVTWWKQKRGGGACESKGGGGGVKALQLESVSGVFVVTIMGCFIASIFAFFEFLIGTRQAAKDGNKSWLEEMTRELKFIMKCHGNTKEVDVNESENGSHSSHLSIEDPYSRGKEEPPYSRGKEEPPYSRGKEEEPVYMRGREEAPYSRGKEDNPYNRSKDNLDSPYKSRNGLESPYSSRSVPSLRSGGSIPSTRPRLQPQAAAENPFESVDAE